MDRQAVRRWLDGHRAAEQRQLELKRREGVPTPSVSFAAALELFQLADMTKNDPVRRRELAEVRSLWARLKRPWVARRAPG
jgi:hypothetical protein